MLLGIWNFIFGIFKSINDFIYRVNPKDINKLQQAKKSTNVLVWYYADWCGHCQMMKDEWEKLVESKPNVSLAKAQSGPAQSCQTVFYRGRQSCAGPLFALAKVALCKAYGS